MYRIIIWQYGSKFYDGKTGMLEAKKSAAKYYPTLTEAQKKVERISKYYACEVEEA